MAADELLDKLATYRQNGDVPADTEICVCKSWSRDGESVIAYYLASMAEQSVFWLEDVDVNMITEYARVVVSESHLGTFRIIVYALFLHLDGDTGIAAKKQFWYE